MMETNDDDTAADDEIVVIAVDDVHDHGFEHDFEATGGGGDPPRRTGFGGDDNEGPGWLTMLALYLSAFAIGAALAAAYKAGEALKELRVGGGN